MWLPFYSWDTQVLESIWAFPLSVMHNQLGIMLVVVALSLCISCALVSWRSWYMSRNIISIFGHASLFCTLVHVNTWTCEHRNRKNSPFSTHAHTQDPQDFLFLCWDAFVSLRFSKLTKNEKLPQVMRKIKKLSSIAFLKHRKDPFNPHFQFCTC